MTGKPGPVYIDCPGDMYQKIDENLVDWSYAGRPLVDLRPLGDPRQVAALVDALQKAKNPIVVSGSGVIWSQAWDEMKQFVEAAGIPFYTTPQGRGVVPDDHPYSYMTMRSGAFRDADLIIVLGMDELHHRSCLRRALGRTRPSPVSISIWRKSPPRRAMSTFRSSATARRCWVSCWMASRAVVTPDNYSAWRNKLSEGENQKRNVAGANKFAEDGDIHPVRMLEAVRDFMDRDAILCVDGQETLNSRPPDDVDLRAGP